jgi:NADH-quinone oxidoreductase subunit J
MNGAENKELPMQKIGEALLSTDVNGYILPFEFISVFLLACIIGGVMMARKEEVATNSDKEDK